jgi:hypothetical protein
METTDVNYRKFIQSCYLDPSLMGLVNISFKDIDPNSDIKFILKKLGWHGVRERLACQYLEYIQNGKFSNNVKLEHLEGITVLDNKLKVINKAGHSRGFLLGFYFKAWSILDNKNYIHDFLLNMVGDYTNLTEVNLIGNDWLILSLLHLEEFIGKGKLIHHIEQGGSFEDLYVILDKKQREILYSNCLRYGASINDVKSFVS